MTEILRFEMNVPADVTLKHAGPGKPIEGRYGNRVMYRLADDRVMYVAPIVATRITDLGIKPGEPFQVRKRLKKQGSRRLIEWDVQRVAAEPETELERDLRESIAIAKDASLLETNEESNLQPSQLEQTAPLDAKSTPAIVSVSTESCGGIASGAGRNGDVQSETNLEDPTKPTGSADRAPRPEGDCTQYGPVRAVPGLTPAIAPAANRSANVTAPSASRDGNHAPVTTRLEHALKTAISAACNAEKYSAELGYVVRFDADAIKSMAITVLINMSEGNRR